MCVSCVSLWVCCDVSILVLVTCPCILAKNHFVCLTEAHSHLCNVGELGERCFKSVFLVSETVQDETDETAYKNDPVVYASLPFLLLSSTLFCAYHPRSLRL